MGKAQRLSEDQISPQHGQQESRTGLDVPSDWYVDPADPGAATKWESADSLQQQATAFLAAAEENSEEDKNSAVTALSEAPSRRTTSSTPAETATGPDSVWMGLPTLIPAEQIEGELAWQVDALCAQTDPEAFFPEKGGSTRDAKKICGACEVKQECLDYAMSNDERFGIWGGLSERERRKLKKRAL